MAAAGCAGGPRSEFVAGAIGLGGWLRWLNNGAVAIEDGRLPSGVGFAVHGIGIVNGAADRRSGRGRVVLRGFDVTATADGEAREQERDEER